MLATIGLGAATVAGGAAGLARPVHHKMAVPPAPPPDALVIALSDVRRLDVAYTAALTRDPADAGLLTSLRSDVRAHADALMALLERYPGWRYEQSLPTPTQGATASPYPSPSSSPSIGGSGAALRAALSEISASTGRACVTWPATESHALEAVGLLGSIAATLATHLEVLS